MNQFEILQKEKSPASISSWLDKNKGKEAQAVIQENEKTYLVMTRGQMSSSGFSINVNDFKEQEDKIIVKITYVDPKPDQMVMQIITYPAIILELKKTNKNIEIELENGTKNKMVKELNRSKPRTEDETEKEKDDKNKKT